MNYLIIDDDTIFADTLARAITRKGYSALTAYDLTQAKALIEHKQFDRIILDLKIGEQSGLNFLNTIREIAPHVDVVLLTGYSSIRTAVEAIKLGAVEYLCKPVETDDILRAFDDKKSAATPTDPPAEPPSVKRLEWEHIQTVLMQNDGNVSATARALGMHRRTLQRKLQKRPVNR